MKLENSAARARRARGRGTVRVHKSVKGLAGRVGDHEPRRNTRGDQRADYRSRRGSDDVIGSAGIPAGFVRERCEAARQPGASKDAAGAQDEADFHTYEGSERQDVSLAGFTYTSFVHGG